MRLRRSSALMVTAQPTEPERQQVAGHDHGRERLGRRHADLGAGVHVERAGRLAGERGAHHVGDGQDRTALQPRRLDRAERVGRLAGLRDRHHQRLRPHDGVAVAELGAEVDLGRQAGQPLDHGAAEQRGVRRGAAGHEHHALDGPGRRGVEVDVGQQDVAGLQRDAAAEGVGDRARLLVHLLEHEVPVAALLGHDRIPEDPHRLALHGLVVDRAQLDGARGDHRDLVVLQDHDVAGVGQDGRDVGGDEHLAAAEADHHAAGAVLGGDQPIGRRGGHHADRVRAAELAERALDRAIEPDAVLDVVLDQVREDLGVGLRPEGVALGLELLLDLEIVLEDSVVDDDQRTRAVGVGMGVLVGRDGRGSPSACGRCRCCRRAGARAGPLEVLQPAGRASHLQTAAAPMAATPAES